jgi:hypothetical protein
MSTPLSSSDICQQLQVTGGSEEEQAAAKAVVAAAISESLRLGPVAIAQRNNWNRPAAMFRQLPERSRR